MKIYASPPPLTHLHRLGLTPSRRGLLLLMTLMMLSLFMMAGMLMLTIAIRARQASRANFAAIQQTALTDKVPREALDEALFALLRGTMSGGTPSVAVVASGSASLENLLEDKYGTSVTGTATTLSGTSEIIMSLESAISSLSPTVNEPSRLNGRILTIKPEPDDGDVISFRILGSGTTTSGTYTLYLANPPSLIPRRFPTKPSFDIVINGREFTPDGSTGLPEPYDAFDDANLWLAQPVIVSGTVAGMRRVSFGGEVEYKNSSKQWEVAGGDFIGRPLEVDNDNDGVLDGIWISGTAPAAAPSLPPFVIADRPAPTGGLMKFEVSYLVLDLDGRININACGTAMVSGTYPTSPVVPIGMGYGTADLDCSHLFAPTAPTLPSYGGIPNFPTTWSNLLLSGTPSESTILPPTLRRRPPLIGPIDGRYGDDGAPGKRNVDDSSLNQWTLSGTSTILSGTATFAGFSVVSGTNALDDLKAHFRVFVDPPASASDDLMPTLKFVRPSNANDWEDDPYEIRLDSSAPRLGVAQRAVPAGGSDDNPFTLEELERILRPNDPDVTGLPQRLAAGMETVAQRNRFFVTTDSWSSPAITGAAAAAIENFLATELTLPLSYSAASWSSALGPPTNAVSPDTAAGLKFNINRPILSGTSVAAQQQQHEFCKGLYTLGVIATGSAASPTVDEIAQWAVNVLDFRDEDSICTAFEYDRNIKNGWDVDGDLTSTTDGGSDRAVVFGVERPELLITEAAAWRDTTSGTAQLLVNLCRLPFRAEKVTTSGMSQVEKPDALLVDNNGELLLSSTGSNPRAIWQLRFGASDVVQFKNANKTTGPVHILSGTAVDSPSVTIHGTTLPPSLLSSGTTHVCVATAASVTGATINVPVCPVDKDGPFHFGVNTGSGKVILERLANPDLPNSASNPFIPMDEVEFTAIPDVSAGGTPSKKRRKGPHDNSADRLGAFWRRDFEDQPANPITIGKYVDAGAYSSSSVTTGTAPVSWFHWPNRPFISQAELALIPTGVPSTSGMLATYSGTSNSLANDETQRVIGTGTTSIGQIILDATYVPSRFVENGITISGTMPREQAIGFDNLQRLQLPKWREPGLINVNTIGFGKSDPGSDVNPEDDIVWHILMSGTTRQNVFAAKPPRGAIPAVPGDPKLGTATEPAVPASPNGTPARPARSVAQILSGTTAAGKYINFQTITSGTALAPRAKNPFFTAAEAIRLANTVTATSNCFAVWVTVRITDTSPCAGSPITKRLFAIIDRSIPVGYSPNEDLNVRDCIRLKRYIN